MTRTRDTRTWAIWLGALATLLGLILTAAEDWHALATERKLPTPQATEGERYWLNSRTAIYHRAGCQHWQRTQQGVLVTPTEARKLGTPCRVCLEAGSARKGAPAHKSHRGAIYLLD